MRPRLKYFDLHSCTGSVSGLSTWNADGGEGGFWTEHDAGSGSGGGGPCMIGPPTPPLIPTSGFVQKPLPLPSAFDAQGRPLLPPASCSVQRPQDPPSEFLTQGP